MQFIRQIKTLYFIQIIFIIIKPFHSVKIGKHLNISVTFKISFNKCNCLYQPQNFALTVNKCAESIC